MYEMSEHDLKKTDSAVSYIRYLFDPDDNSMKCSTITTREWLMVPEFGKVVHYSGRRYAIYLRGKEDTLEERQAAFNLFKQFYLNKLADAAEEVSKFATILTYFE